MNEDLLQVVVTYASLIAGLALVIKWIVTGLKDVFLPGKWARLTALAVGALFGFTYVLALTDLNPALGVILGIFAGAASIGDYDASKRLTISNLLDKRVAPVEMSPNAPEGAVAPEFSVKLVPDSTPVNETTPPPTSTPDGDDSANPSQ
jgi:hypothetical protein